MIRAYTDADFDTLNRWIPDADVLFQFSGPDWSFPLTHDSIRAYQASHASSGLRRFYVGCNDHDHTYAFGEIIDGDDHSPRLARIIVDPAQRGKGLGEQFLRELLKEWEQRFQTPHIYLFVWDINTTAIRCYEKLGFRYDGVERTAPFAGREERMRRMVYYRDTGR